MNFVIKIVRAISLVEIITLGALVGCSGSGNDNSGNESSSVESSDIVASVFPLSGSMGVSLNQNIHVTLTQASLQEAASFSIDYSIRGPQGNLAGAIIYDDSSSATFQLANRMSSFSRYMIDASIRVVNIDGSVQTDDVSWSFTTAWTQVTTSSVSGCCSAVDQVIDPNGNIYIAGYTEGNFDGNLNKNINDSFSEDGFVVKYSPTSEKLWSAQFGTAGDEFVQSVATDQQSNVYVTGHLNSSGGDIFVTKISSEGEEQWTRYFDSGEADFAKSIAVDNAGDIIVAALNYFNSQVVIKKYSPDGQVLWSTIYADVESTTNIFHSQDTLVVDSANNIYILVDVQKYLRRTSVAQYYSFLGVIKYSQYGQMEWETLIEPTPSLSSGNQGIDGSSIAIDSNDNIYSAGNTFGYVADQQNRGYQDRDAFIIKLSSLGDQIWAKQFGSSESDSANIMWLDENDNIYLFGSTGGQINSNFSMFDTQFFAKYTPVGVQEFVRPFERIPGVFGTASFIADYQGHFYQLANGVGSVDGVLDNSVTAAVLLRNDMELNKE